jgi:hypothetical protein
MTILIEPGLVNDLSLNNENNNPFFAYANVGSATVTTATGTEVNTAANAASGATYNFWKATPSGGVAVLQFVFASAVSVNFVGLAAHNLGTVTARVKVRYSTDGGSNWTDVLAGQDTPTDNQAIGFRFRAVSAAQWQIYIDQADSDVVVGVAVLSSVIQMPRRIYKGYTPPLTPTDVSLQSNVSEGGHYLGSSVERRSSSASAEFTYVTPVFLRSASWLAFQAHFNEGGAFFWAWRPSKYEDLFYAWRSGGVAVPVNAGVLDLMNVTLDMRFYDEP